LNPAPLFPLQKIFHPENRTMEERAMKMRMLAVFFILASTGSTIAQKMAVKDGDNHSLMEVNDEGTVGSITLPDTSQNPAITTNKLYNIGGTLYWNGSALQTAGGSSYWSLTGNSGTTAGTNFIGTTDNVVLQLKVNNARIGLFEPNGTSPNIVMGYSGNVLSSGVFGSTVAGGGTSGSVNTITDNYSTIGGGLGNEAGDSDGNPADQPYITIGGGQNNHATGYSGFIGGGRDNVIGNDGDIVVAGGYGNNASGYGATISGGYGSTAAGQFSMVPGGHFNSAAGSHSLAAGRKAKANHAGAFVWADATDADFASNQANSFIIRASGGVGIGLNNPAQALDVSGTVQMTGFKLTSSPSAGYVLTSDAGGAGSWQAVVGGSDSDWTISGSNMYSGVTGNVGIGTSSPNLFSWSPIEKVLSLKSSSTNGYGVLEIAGNDISGSGGALIALGSGTTAFSEMRSEKVGTNGGNLQFRTRTDGGSIGTRLFIDDAGNTGIGTTSPGSKLEVNGTVQMTGFKMTSSPTAGYVLTSDAGGAGTWQAVGAGSTWGLTGNSGTTAGTDFIGTSDNVALELKVNNTRVVRFSPDATSPVIVGGYSGNSSGSTGAFIGGGGLSGSVNTVTANYGVVVGGQNNQNGGSFGFIGSGRDNVIGNDSDISLPGGYGNNASGYASTISGGYGSTASGQFGMVPGGHFNSAAGDHSLAAGRRAKANHAGAFVWADATDADFASNQANSFIIRASGGVGIGTNSPAGALDVSSSTQGFLPPRMTTSQRDAMSSPPEGVLVYNTSTHKMNYYNGASWVEI
jgi:hypothetical protein